MKRLLYKNLIRWKKSLRRKPLLLQGARQVGKTYILKEFGNNEYENLAYFNFEETPELKELFLGELKSSRLINVLSAFSTQRIIAEKTLIFFDEIQISPRAITSLKYFQEEAPEFHVVAAGSLLGVSVGKSSAFPVGKVNFMNLYPLSFQEFLLALNEENLLKIISEKVDFEPLPELLHIKLQEYYQKFLYIGGMPEVVKYFRDEMDYIGVREIQNEIVKAYSNDFSKYASPQESIKISEIWNSIPTQLAKENKKFKYSDIKSGSRSSQYSNAIEWLKNAGLIHLVYCVTTPKLPLLGYCDKSKMKLLLLDTGLLGAMLHLTSKQIMIPSAIYREYNGAFIENSVGCELVVNTDSELFYWTSNSIAEVDYLIENGEEIIPVEVKSGMNRNIKSLRSYANKYSPNRIVRISPRNYTSDSDLRNVPLYSTSFLQKILTETK